MCAPASLHRPESGTWVHPTGVPPPQPDDLLLLNSTKQIQHESRAKMDYITSELWPLLCKTSEKLILLRVVSMCVHVLHMHTGPHVLELCGYEITTAALLHLLHCLLGALYGCIWSSSRMCGLFELPSKQVQPEPLITRQCLKLITAFSKW